MSNVNDGSIEAKLIQDTRELEIVILEKPIENLGYATDTIDYFVENSEFFLENTSFDFIEATASLFCSLLISGFEYLKSENYSGEARSYFLRQVIPRLEVAFDYFIMQDIKKGDELYSIASKLKKNMDSLRSKCQEPPVNTLVA